MSRALSALICAACPRYVRWRLGQSFLSGVQARPGRNLAPAARVGKVGVTHVSGHSSTQSSVFTGVGHFQYSMLQGLQDTARLRVAVDSVTVVCSLCISGTHFHFFDNACPEQPQDHYFSVESQ